MCKKCLVALFASLAMGCTFAQKYGTVEAHVKNISHNGLPQVDFESSGDKVFGVARWRESNPLPDGGEDSTRRVIVFVLQKVDDTTIEEVDRSNQLENNWPPGWPLDGVDADKGSGFSIYVFHGRPLGRRI